MEYNSTSGKVKIPRPWKGSSLHPFGMYSWAKRLNKSLKVTPAMAAGVTDELLEMEDIVKLIDKAAPKPGRPKTYKKKA